jgi:thioredoxin-like negative regulator of GroEL
MKNKASMPRSISCSENKQTAPNDYQAYFDLAVCLFSEHDIERGIEALFFIQENDAEFKEGAAKEMIGLFAFAFALERKRTINPFNTKSKI